MKKREPLGTNSPAMQRALTAIINHGPLTNQQVADRAHVSLAYWQNTIRAALIREGLIHQSGWERNHPGYYSPIFTAGPNPKGRAKPTKPAKVTNSARSKDWKERTGYLEAQKAARRLRNPPDPVLAALMGMGR